MLDQRLSLNLYAFSSPTNESNEMKLLVMKMLKMKDYLAWFEKIADHNSANGPRNVLGIQKDKKGIKKRARKMGN